MGPNGPGPRAQMNGPNEWAQQGPNESPRMGPNEPGPRAQMNGPNRAQMNGPNRAQMNPLEWAQMNPLFNSVFSLGHLFPDAHNSFYLIMSNSV